MQKVSHGQKFSTALKADTWNAFVDAAQYVKDRRLDQGGGRENLPDDTILVRNDSGLVVPQYGALWARHILDVDWDLPIVLRPTCPFISQIVIAAEPMAAAANTVGRVWFSGIHPVLISYSPGHAVGLTGWDSPHFAITQTDSFELAMPGDLSWGVPILSQAGVTGRAMARLPIVPPPMVKILLTSEQMTQVYEKDSGSTRNYLFNAAFLAFPDSDQEDIASVGPVINFGGLSVE